MDLEPMTTDAIKCLVYDKSIELNDLQKKAQEIQALIIKCNDEIIKRSKE